MSCQLKHSPRPEVQNPELQKYILNYLLNYIVEKKKCIYHDRIFIIHVFRKKFIENKFSEKFLSWVIKLLSCSSFCFTDIFEGKINHQQILL